MPCHEPDPHETVSKSQANPTACLWKWGYPRETAASAVQVASFSNH